MNLNHNFPLASVASFLSIVPSDADSFNVVKESDQRVSWKGVEFVYFGGRARFLPGARNFIKLPPH